MTVAPSDTSHARKSQPGSRLQLWAKRESTPIRLSPRWNHRAHRDTAIPPCHPPHWNRRARARSMQGKRAPLPTANHRAHTRIGRTVDSKPETPCPDEKNMSLGPKAPSLHWCSGELLARRGSAAALCSEGRSAIQCSPLALHPLRNAGMGQLPAHWATRPGRRLPRNPPGRSRQEQRRRD
jgi:hypothetical protein